jgi:hypothetical protein
MQSSCALHTKRLPACSRYMDVCGWPGGNDSRQKLCPAVCYRRSVCSQNPHLYTLSSHSWPFDGTFALLQSVAYKATSWKFDHGYQSYEADWRGTTGKRPLFCCQARSSVDSARRSGCQISRAIPRTSMSLVMSKIPETDRTRM